MTIHPLSYTAHRAIGYHLGLHGGQNGGQYADLADVEPLIKLYADELTADEIEHYRALLKEKKTGQMKLL